MSNIIDRRFHETLFHVRFDCAVIQPHENGG